MLAQHPFPSHASTSRVLVVEDEEVVRAHIAERLTQAGWIVETAEDGADGLEMALSGRFDVIVVDRLLPKLDGLELVRTLRARQAPTPVILLTALGAVADRVAGLEGGADDYLVKPFSQAELNARVTALARRPALGGHVRTTLRVEDLVFDRLARAITRNGRPIELLPLEFRLLEFLMLNLGKPVTRTMLLERVWGFNFDPRTNIVETHLSRLRAKLSPEGEPSLIRTIRGVGYVIGADA